MYQHILVPTDGSELSLKAIETASRLAKQVGAKITALYVIEPYRAPRAGEIGSERIGIPTPDQYQRHSEQYAEVMLGDVKRAVEQQQVRCDTTFVTDEAPWEAIISAAKGRDCDLIVMASHGRRGLEGLLLGSETQKVLTHSKTPVLVCR